LEGERRVVRKTEFDKNEKMLFKKEWNKVIKLLKRSCIDLSKIKLTTTMEITYND
jgi:hypothetical protein